ncbi:MAG TPA: hypothetical protein PLS68_12340 [Actinotalea sp.]|nr:hypothetical protein [Actinotalea sp.]
MPHRGPHRARRRPYRLGAFAAAGALALALGAAGCAGAATPTADDVATPSSAAADATTTTARTATEEQGAASSLVTTAPDEHSEVGDVVEGFPVDLLPLPPDAVILVTSAVPVGEAGVQEVSLNVRTPATAVALMDLYRAALVGAGFVEVPVTSTSLAAESTFTRSGGDELVSIGVLDADGVRTVTIGGRVRTAP